MDISIEQFKNLLAEFGEGTQNQKIEFCQYWRPLVSNRNYTIEIQYRESENLIEVLAIYPETEEFEKRSVFVGSAKITDKSFEPKPSRDETFSLIEREEIFEKIRQHLAPHLDGDAIPVE